MSKAVTATNGLPAIVDWMDPLEQAVRRGVHDYLQNLLEEDSDAGAGALAASPGGGCARLSQRATRAAVAGDAGAR